MAETEVIITKFEADLSGLDAGVSDYEKQLNAASGATDKLDAKTTELGASVGKLGPKFEVVKQSAERTHKEIELTGQSIDQLKAKLANLTKARGGLIDPKAIAKSNADIAAVRNQITKLETSVAGARKGAGGLFGSITQGAQQAAPGLSNVTSLFSGMGGPIGIAAAAVAGFIANFSRLDSVQVFFDALKVGFDQVGDRLANLDFSSFFDPKTQAEDAAFAAQVADALDRIQDAQLGVNKANAEAELQIAGLNQQLRDGTKTTEDRVAIAGQIAEIERKRAAEEQGFLRVQVALQKGINAQQVKTLGEVSDANKAALNEREIALIASQQRTVQLTETTERRVNSITEQGAAERAAINAKAAAAKAKADAEAAKNAEARAQAQGKVDGILDSIAAEQLARTQSDAEKEVAVTVKKFDALAQATVEGFEKIRAASPASEQAELFQKEADALVAIDAAKNAELAANAKTRADLQAKTQEENIERLRQSLLTETQLQQEAILQQLDADLLLAEQTLATQEERDAFRIEAVRKAQGEITAIIVDEAQKQLAAQEELKDAEAALLQTKIDAAGAAGAIFKQIAGDSLEAQIAGLAIEKAAAIAGVVVQTQAAIAASAAAAAAVPPILSPGVPNPAFPIAQALSAAQIAKLKLGAGINIATILAQALSGAYQGEERVGVNERPVFPGPRDRYFRKVHKNEGIVDAKTNMAFLPEINAMRKGTYDDLIYKEHIAPAIAALGYGDMGTVNNFVGSDTGQRIAQSVMLAKFYDANIVGELKRNQRQGRVQVELLAQIAKNGRRNASRW